MQENIQQKAMSEKKEISKEQEERSSMEARLQQFEKDSLGIPMVTMEDLLELLNNMDGPRTFVVTVFPPENLDENAEGR